MEQRDDPLRVRKGRSTHEATAAGVTVCGKVYTRFRTDWTLGYADGWKFADDDARVTCRKCQPDADDAGLG